MSLLDPIELYVTGTGQILRAVHPHAECEGQSCVIHNPSNHKMREFKTHWREDREIIERVCPHGVGHPDPDVLDYIRRTQGDDAMRVESVHGCDGCCR